METNDNFFSTLMANGPSPGTYFHVLSRIKETGQLRKVIQMCLKALHVYPDDTRIRQLLAESYMESGQICLAEKELELIATRIDEMVSSYLLMAEIYRRGKRTGEAVHILKLYLEHRPHDKEALRTLETLEHYEEQVEPQPLTEDHIPLEKDGDQDDTSREPEGLPEIATPTLAEIYLEQGQMQEALATYEKIIAGNPDDERSRRRLGEITAMTAEKGDEQVERTDSIQQKTEKVIEILETWKNFMVTSQVDRHYPSK